MELTFVRAPRTVRDPANVAHLQPYPYRSHANPIPVRSTDLVEWSRALSLVAFASVALAINAGAQEYLVRQNGGYLYIPQPADRSGIERAIDDAVSEMSILTRGIARKRLHQSTEPIHRFQVHFEPDLVLLRLHEHEFALPLDGRAVPAKGLDGNQVKASMHIRGDTLYQKLEGSQGTRYHEFHFRDDGSVSVWTRIESEHLPMRVSYNLQYHRTP